MEGKMRGTSTQAKENAMSLWGSPMQQPKKGPEKPFDPRGGTIFERPGATPPPGQMPPEKREGSRGGPERRG